MTQLRSRLNKSGLVGGAIVVVLLASAADASAVRRCGTQLGFYPGATHIRAEHLSCDKANRVVRAYRRKWARTNQPPDKVQPRGMATFRCSYELVSDGQTSYGRVRCRHSRREARRVRFRIVS